MNRERIFNALSVILIDNTQEDNFLNLNQVVNTFNNG